MTTSIRGDSTDGGILHDGVEIATFDEDTFTINGNLTVNGTRSGTGFRNRIIGGDFHINPWVRGTSFAAIASAAYSADRFVYGASIAAVLTVLKTADGPTPAQAGVYSPSCFHVDVTTADASLAAGDTSVFHQRIEGYNIADAGFGQAGTRYITLSFWHKHTKTGTHCVAFKNSAVDRSYIAEYTQAVTDTWEKATLTVPVDTSGTWLYDEGTGLQVTFNLASGTTHHAAAADIWSAGNFSATAACVNNLDSTSNNFKIALVQLEVGEVATSFEVRSRAVEEQLCYRYCPAFIADSTTSGVGMGQCNLTTAYILYCPFLVRPRITPTGITISNVAHLTLTDGVTATASTGIAFQSDTSLMQGAVTVTVAAGLTQFRVGRARFNSAAGYILFTGCEL
jgi:hypothetical protein